MSRVKPYSTYLVAGRRGGKHMLCVLAMLKHIGFLCTNQGFYSIPQLVNLVGESPSIQLLEEPGSLLSVHPNGLENL